MKLKKQEEPNASVDMTPMIDCVFLLLVFFMVSTTFNKQEADISFALPGTAEQSDLATLCEGAQQVDDLDASLE